MGKAKLVQEVIFLAMTVQEETSHCVFVSFSGHVENMSISIRESKEDYKERICDCNISLDSECALERLQEVKMKLLGFLEAGEVNTSEMAYDIEQVRRYKF